MSKHRNKTTGGPKPVKLQPAGHSLFKESVFAAQPEWVLEQRRKGKTVIIGKTGKTWILPTKLYTPQEVVDAIDESTLNVLEFIGEWGDGDFSNLIESTLRLREAISDILGYVRRTKGKLVHVEKTPLGKVYQFPFTDDELEVVSGTTLRIITIMSRMEIDRERVKDLDELLDAGVAIGLALGGLLSNQDDGAALREAAALFKPPSASILNWIDLNKKPGPKPTPSKKEIEAWLHMALINAWGKADPHNQEQAFEDVKTSLSSHAGHLEGIELAVHQWLEKEAEENKDTSANIWRNMRRKGVLKELKSDKSLSESNLSVT